MCQFFFPLAEISKPRFRGFISESFFHGRIREISHRVTSIKVLVREMTEARKVANHKDNYKERAFEYEEKVRPYLDKIRDHIDHLEMEVDDEIWPLPKYRELLFTK